MSQTFSDRSLTHPRFTDQDRIVLCTTAQDLQNTADLVITTDHGIELAASGTFVQVDSVFTQ